MPRGWVLDATAVVLCPVLRFYTPQSGSTPQNHWVLHATIEFHVPLPDRLAQDVFIEGPGEVTLEQPVVVDGFGHDAPHKLEVAEVVGVAVGRGVDGVGDPVARRGAEQGVHGVEHLPGDDHVPLAQQPPGVLPLLALKDDVPAAWGGGER